MLGPWRTGTTGARAVTNGHQGPGGTAGRLASSSGSSHDASRRIRLWSRRSEVRTLSPNCRGPAALANQAASPRTGPHPLAELVPSVPGPSNVYPHRPCPGRALSIGRPRSFTDNKGRCVFPPSCGISPSGAVRGSFPSSRWAALGPQRGRNRAATDRNAADNHGQPQPSSVRLNSTPRPSTAGHGHPSIRSDTEGVTGSNPVAPTRHNVSLGPPLSAACQQIVSRSLLVTARTL